MEHARDAGEERRKRLGRGEIGARDLDPERGERAGVLPRQHRGPHPGAGPRELRHQVPAEEAGGARDEVDAVAHRGSGA